MKKKAIIFGNNKGLSGVENDCKNMCDFLIGPYGGYWNEDEILWIPFETSAECIREYINITREEKYDFVFLYFSGHGGLRSSYTILEVNSEGEQIFLRDLLKIADKQISIVDCCRITIPLSSEENFSICEEINSSFNNIKKIIRDTYEKRISEALPQQVIMYSCSKEEYSYDLGDGSRFTKELLKSLQNPKSKFKLVNEAFIESAKETSKSSESEQNPEICMPKLSPIYQLPLSINPYSLRLTEVKKIFNY